MVSFLKRTGTKKKNGLQRKLITSFFLLILFPLIIVGVFAYNITALSVKSEVSRYISEVLQQTNDNIDTYLTELDRATLILSLDEEIQTILKKDRDRSPTEFMNDDNIIKQKIDMSTKYMQNIEGLFIFSYNGEVYHYMNANNSIKPDYIFTRTRWFSALKNLNQKTMLIPTHIQDQVIAGGQPKKVFSYVREIIHLKTKQPIGYIMVDMNTKIFDNILEKLDVREFQEFLIIDNNKTILYHTKKENISTQFRSGYITDLLNMKKGTMIRKVESREMLITFNTSSSTNWTVISIIPIDILYRSVSFLEVVILFTVIICLLLSLMIAMIISRNITRPISDLRELMRRAELGEFNVQIPVKTTDEIGELSLSFNSMITKINNLIQTVYETKILKREAELNALQSQINPHFLYNTLQIMDIIAEDEGIFIIGSICKALSKLFRYSINRGKEIVPISSEIEHLKNYIYIQKIRFKDKFEVIYNIDEYICDYRIIKLILQPLVENAILHGTEKKIGQCKIIISGVIKNDTIEICVEDTGVGMDENHLQKIRRSLNDEIIHAETYTLSRGSIGIINVSARIKLYFGEQYGLQIDSNLNQGTKVKVVIPAIKHKGEVLESDSKNISTG